ncbi:uncharacterized protein [Apostichopus japonicus]
MQLVYNSAVCYLALLAFIVSSADGSGQRYCGEALLEAMAYVCGDRGYFGVTSGIRGRSVSRSPFLTEERANSFLTNERTRKTRRTGRIVTECCDNPCSQRNLESYCNVATTQTTEIPTELTTEGTTTEPAASPRRNSRNIEADGTAAAAGGGSGQGNGRGKGKGRHGKGNRREQDQTVDVTSAETEGNTEPPRPNQQENNEDNPGTPDQSEERPRDRCRGSKKKGKCRNQDRVEEEPTQDRIEEEPTTSREVSSTDGPSRERGSGSGGGRNRGNGKGKGKGSQRREQSEELTVETTTGCASQDGRNCEESNANAGGASRRPGKTGKGKGNGRRDDADISSSERNTGDIEEEGTVPTSGNRPSSRESSQSNGKGGGKKKLSKAEKKRQRKLLRKQEKADRKAERKTGKSKKSKSKNKNRQTKGDRERRTTVRWNSNDERSRRQVPRDSFSSVNGKYNSGHPYRRVYSMDPRRTAAHFRSKPKSVRQIRRRPSSSSPRKVFIKAR